MAAHATLGASSAERWMTCPGSVALSEGMPDFESGYAREGSAAHALGEHCLLNDEDPFEYLGEPMPDKNYADIEVDVGMVDAVTVYVNHIRELTGGKVDPKSIECRFSLEKLGTWFKGMFGTADFSWYRKDSHYPYEGHNYKCLYVRDYKHGAGLAVKVQDNPQLKYYALGALLQHGLITRKKEDNTLALPLLVDVGIVQPRKPHEDGPVRTQLFHAQELLDWGMNELKDATSRVRAASLKAVEGEDWVNKWLQPSEKGCQFCKAKGVCPALAKKSMDDAMLDFNEEGDIVPTIDAVKLKPEQIAKILDSEKTVKNWLAGVAALAQEHLEHGQDVTGGAYKLVAGRSSRNWKDQKAAEKAMLDFGVDRAKLFEEKFVSVAAAEKLIGKEQKKELSALVDKQDGEATLAPASDKRPAIVKGPEADFDSDSGEAEDDLLG